ncbi:MAG: SDR family NAD(P)-dependent oxidoreductase [Candidatus Kapaibacterium sp.]
MNIDSSTVIAITGASSGIGAALALELAHTSCALAICARRAGKLAEVAAAARERGARVLEVACDISDDAAARDFIARTIAEFGTIDVLINNAGRGNRASVEHTTRERLQSIFELNVFSLWSTTAAALPVMKRNRRGHIITISSVAGKTGYGYNSAYVAAKHAAVGFVASLRAELVDTGVRATVVCPAGVTTEWSEASEDASIGALFAEGIKRSRSIAREQGLPLPPLKPMMSAVDAAKRIIRVVTDDEENDVYTHEGSETSALHCATDRSAYEHGMKALYLGMQQAYANLSSDSE